MCGIAGLFSASMATEARVDCLRGMLQRIHHRGPDEYGYYFDEHIAIGTVRLSIVDLAGGQQPMCDAHQRYWISYNGEIYNYKQLAAQLTALGCRFATQCDTEVLLQAWIVWGPAALQRLNGAFAFCIYDRVERSVILGRDRFGKRPLFYLEQAGCLVFGSEIKCLLAYEPFELEFDAEQLATILSVWTTVGDQSGYRSVRQVPAGAYLRAADGSTSVHHYVQLNFADSAPPASEAHATQLVYERLSESVRLRLCGDVDVATYISGGIDSAIIARLVAENRGATRSFSISFEDEEFDESADQAAVSSYLGTQHSRLVISAADLVNAFPDALWHAEVPVFRTAFVPMFLLSKLVSDSGFKVVLTGEGADEAFLGYDIFKETLLRQSWSQLDVESRKEKLGLLYPYLRGFDSANQTALYSLFSRMSQQAGAGFFSHDIRFHNSRLSARLLAGNRDGLQRLALETRAQHAGFMHLSALQRAQWLEIKTLLAGYLLSTQGDRMSLAHGVENRCPFLDPQVVSLGFATNLQFDDGFNEKYLLRRAFAGKLPERVLHKHKRPYVAPDASAFLTSSPDYLEMVLSQQELKKIDLLDHRFCAAFIDRLKSKPPTELSQAENQTFIFLLSIALLHSSLIEAGGVAPAAFRSEPVRQIDGRSCV